MRDPQGPSAYAQKPNKKRPTSSASSAYYSAPKSLFGAKKKKKRLSEGVYSSAFPKSGVNVTNPRPYSGGTSSWAEQNLPTALPNTKAAAAALPSQPSALPGMPNYNTPNPIDKLKARKKAAQNLWKTWWV